MTTSSLDYEINGLHVQLPRRIADYRCTYPGQACPQPAFFKLMFEGESGPYLCATFNGEVGSNAVPGDVYTGRTLRFSFPCSARLRDVRQAMKDVAPLCAELARGYDTRFDGQNMVGVYDRGLRSRIQHTLDDAFGVERY